jgi:serine/threonine protein kinase
MAGGVRAAAEASEPAAGTFSEAVAVDRIIRHLGSGSMGEVFEVERAGGERVAVKYLAPRLASQPGALAAFRAEARIAGKLNHSRCVRVLGYEENPPRIVMELMEGRTLKDAVALRGPLPTATAVGYALDLIEGLQAVHALGVVHRDVKPGNGFLTADDRVKLGDFGLSAEFEQSSEEPPLGTVLFSSPEQLRGEAAGFDSDQYSACATLYFLLCGKAPHETTSLTASMARAMSESAPSLRAKGIGIAPGLERIVLKGLERNRARRWPDLGRLRTALEPYADSGTDFRESKKGGGGWLRRILGRH